MHNNRVERHEIGDQTLADTRVSLKIPNKIAVSENSEQLLILSGDHSRTGANGGHRFEHGADGRTRPNDRERATRSHHLMDAKKQAAPQVSSGVKFREVLLLKTARFQ